MKTTMIQISSIVETCLNKDGLLKNCSEIMKCKIDEAQKKNEIVVVDNRIDRCFEMWFFLCSFVSVL